MGAGLRELDRHEAAGTDRQADAGAAAERVHGALCSRRAERR